MDNNKTNTEKIKVSEKKKKYFLVFTGDAVVDIPKIGSLKKGKKYPISAREARSFKDKKRNKELGIFIEEE
jgi:hypothetical protein